MANYSLLYKLQEKFPERTKDSLYAAILCGEVFIDKHRELNPKRLVSNENTITWLPAQNFVSRAGLKLQHALDTFALNVEGLVVLDAGSSTGGFTDCLLQNGAKLVYAVDSGRNQLAYKLRQDERVLLYEKTLIQDFSPSGAKPDIAVIDLSFRSLVGVILAILRQTKRGLGIALFKPQFELSSAERDFRTIIPTAEHGRILAEKLALMKEQGISLIKHSPAPIKGSKGNQEYLLYLSLS